MSSVWIEGYERQSFPTLEKSINTDVLIIGGGICGLLCAHRLHNAGIDYALVEANTICSGITKNTTAKITVQHSLIYDKLIKKYGAEKAKQYLKANQAALKEYASLCQTVDCDFEYKDSYVYSLAGTNEIKNEAAALNALGIHADVCKTTLLPFPVSCALRTEGQAQFNPIKFAYGITKGLHIYEHTKVRQLIETSAVTDHGVVKAKKIIVATHFPFINKHGSYFMKLYQQRSYVIALENAEQVDGMYVDENESGLSFRNYGDLLLLGGGSHRTGKPGGCWQELREFAKRYYPKAKERYHWATQDCMSLDSVPYIGEYSKSTAGLYVATGFNKWGMTSSMAASVILADMICGKRNPNSPVFSPSRSILHPQLAVNAFEEVSNLLTPSQKRCPHLGCALKWNKYEHSWDCACHGSRFSETGQLIDNPATDDLKDAKQKT